MDWIEPEHTMSSLMIIKFFGPIRENQNKPAGYLNKVKSIRYSW